MIDFGMALQCLKDGCKLERAGWNGKGLYVMMVSKTYLQSMQGLALEMKPFFVIVAESGTTNTWVPSISDIFAEDWRIVD